MRFLRYPLVILLFPFVFSAQENTTISNLLKEAHTKLYTQPEQTGKIAEYILKQKESDQANAQAMFLLAKSFYVRGNFNNAAKSILEAKRLHLLLN